MMQRKVDRRDGICAASAIAILILSAWPAWVGRPARAVRVEPASAPSQNEGDTGSARRSLPPVANPNPLAAPQPPRCRPSRVATIPHRNKAYVTLTGKETSPGHEVVVIDLTGRVEVGRIATGSHPWGIAIHPSGDWALVTHRTSNFLSVIDTRSDVVQEEVAVPFYCEDLVFDPAGRRAYVTNFWKNQVLVVDFDPQGGRLHGRLRDLGEVAALVDAFPPGGERAGFACPACGREANRPGHCPDCRIAVRRLPLAEATDDVRHPVRGVVRARCGGAGCHLHSAGGFYAGPNAPELFLRLRAHLDPQDPQGGPLLRAVRGIRDGGWGDALDGRHHAGRVVFSRADDEDASVLEAWNAVDRSGPGICVGDKPRDLVLSPDGRTLFVANTGSLDVSVVDTRRLREVRRIFVRSPVNDVVWVQNRLVFATLGVGSGHPKARHPGRESIDRDDPEAEFSLRRDLTTGKALPLEEQAVLGPYEDVDGTAQEKFRDITNDLVILDPSTSDVSRYEANEAFTRYTSDSFEALAGDRKGDVSPDLMRVVGAFPEQIAVRGDRLYVAMSGTFEVQEWIVDANVEPANRLTPGRVFPTGVKPVGLSIADDVLIVVNGLGESLTFVDLARGSTSTLSLSRWPHPFPATDFERGEFFVQTSVFSVDQDQSCVHCHYRDASDGKAWSVSQVMGQSRGGEERTGGSREVPDLRALVQKVPFFVEGTLSIDEPLTMMMEHNPLIDFQGRTPAGDFSGVFADPEEQARYARSADRIVVATGQPRLPDGVTLEDLVKRREVHFARVSRRWLGREYGFREFQRFIGEYQAGEPRLLPNPEDPDDPRVRHGRVLFEDPRVGCSACHPAPTFTDKVHPRNQNRSFPPLVTAAPRDDAHTLVSADRMDAILGHRRPWDPDDPGRVEEHEGQFVAPSLRGLWMRPPRLLHHGRALSLREVVCSPDHPALRRFPFPRSDVPRPEGREVGLNERDGLPDTHGTTSHLSVWDVECLIHFLRSIE